MVESIRRQNKHAFDFVAAARLSMYAYSGEPHVDFRAKVLKTVLEKTDHKSCVPFEHGELAGFLSFDEFDAVLVIRARQESRSWIKRFAKNSIEIECGRVDRSIHEHALTLSKHVGKHVRESLHKELRLHLIGHSLGGSIALQFAVNSVVGGQAIESVTAFGPTDCVDVRVRSYLAKHRIPVKQFYHFRDPTPKPSFVDKFLPVGDQIYFTEDNRLVINPTLKSRTTLVKNSRRKSHPPLIGSSIMAKYVAVAELYGNRKCP